MGKENGERQKMVKVTVVYDNHEFDERLRTGFGFSCVVETADKRILFDTGGDSPTLLHNMEELGIDPREIDIIVLSHIHGDHVGGLMGALGARPGVRVYVPKSFPDGFKDEMKAHGAFPVEVSNPVEISNGVYTTGELGTWIKEQSLIVKTKRGLVVITGCAHPGIVNVVRRAKEVVEGEVCLVGGFHLSGASDGEVQNMIKSLKELGVKKVAPCHCTGDRAIKVFEREYGNNFIRTGVGRTIEI